MSRGSYHHGNLKVELLQAARVQLAEDGVAGLSVAKLAKRAGVSPGAPYRHFATRDDLLAAVATQIGAELVASLREAVEGAGEAPAERLAATAGAYAAFALRHGVGLELVFAAELRGPRYGQVHEQSRALMDLLLPLAHEASSTFDRGASLSLLEAHLALAQGYVALQSLGVLSVTALSDAQVAEHATRASLDLIVGTIAAHHRPAGTS